MKSNLSQRKESSIIGGLSFRQWINSVVEAVLARAIESHEDVHKSTSAKAFIKNAFYRQFSLRVIVGTYYWQPVYFNALSS